MEVFEGRPADLTGRLEKERESYDRSKKIEKMA